MPVPDITARATKVREIKLRQGEAQFDKTMDAAVEFIRRRERLSHPPGIFDKGGRFYLDEPSNRRVRAPSRAFPYSQMVHGRTADHVAHVHGVPATDVRTVSGFLDAVEVTDKKRAVEEVSSALSQLPERRVRASGRDR